MTGLLEPGIADAAVTWVAALATLVVLGGLLGERWLFGLAQHLLAGLITGYLALLAIREVLVPRVVEPLAEDPSRADLWLLLGLSLLTAAAPWLPTALGAIPVSVLIGSLAAFALGGAVVGTVLPQSYAAIVPPGAAADVVVGLLALVITVLVLVGLLHATRFGRIGATAAGAGRWLIVAGLGGWLGFLLVSRLALLVDRIGFLVFDWLGLVP